MEVSRPPQQVLTKHLSTRSKKSRDSSLDIKDDSKGGESGSEIEESRPQSPVVVPSLPPIQPVHSTPVAVAPAPPPSSMNPRTKMSGCFKNTTVPMDAAPLVTRDETEEYHQHVSYKHYYTNVGHHHCTIRVAKPAYWSLAKLTMRKSTRNGSSFIMTHPKSIGGSYREAREMLTSGTHAVIKPNRRTHVERLQLSPFDQLFAAIVEDVKQAVGPGSTGTEQPPCSYQVFDVERNINAALVELNCMSKTGKKVKLPKFFELELTTSDDAWIFFNIRYSSAENQEYNHDSDELETSDDDDNDEVER